MVKSACVISGAALCAVLLSCNTLDRAAAERLYFDSSDSLPRLSLPDPGAHGPYTVKSFLYAGSRNPRRPEYAPDKIAVKTAAADVSAFYFPDDTVFSYFLDYYSYLDRVRSAHWGFDQSAVPLNGKVWYPDGDGPFPLVVCVHGNHDPYEASEFGYAWLGELLASRGFVFASIDENFLNGSTDGRENDARAAVLLHHARLILSWNADSSTPLAGKLDGENVALIGHSRGGEAAATAAIFNSLSAYPDRAEVAFAWNLPIKAVVSLAPVEGQYRAGRRTLSLPGVDFLLIHGSADGDVNADMGLRFFNRGTPAAGTFRSSFWIYGANHAQFNSDWARHQDPVPTLRSNLLTTAEQQKLTGALISAFLETSFGRQPGYAAFLKDWRTGRAWLPATVIVAQYRDADTKPIADYEEDGDPATLTIPGWAASASGCTAWAEQPLALDATYILHPRLRESELHTQNTESWAVMLRWTEGAPAEYALRASGEGRKGNTVCFDLAAFDLPAEDALLDFTLELTCAAGEVMRYRFADHYALAAVPGTWIAIKYYSRPHVLSSVRIPLPGDREIREIRFRFDGTERGTVLLDNVAVTTATEADE